MPINKFLTVATLASTTLVAETLIAGMNKPNVVFILADDLTYDGIHALNNPELITPNMDGLVNSGTAFTNTHIQGANSGAVCAPSRAMLMTGRNFLELPFPFVVVWKGPKKERGVCPYKTFPEVFRENGYRTFVTGKQHNGNKIVHRGFTDGGNIFFGGMHNNEGGHLKPRITDFAPNGAFKKSYIGNKFSTELFTDAALDFIAKTDKSKPFMMYVSYTAPHDPRMAPQKYIDMYPISKISLSKSFLKKHPFNNGALRIRDETLSPYPRTEKRTKQEIAGYYAMITHMDDQIKRIVDAIKAKGETENTLFVLAGDNGLAIGKHGLIGKQNLYEHSIGVPLIFSGPGFEKGKKIDALCYLNDLFPTFCDILKVEKPSSITSKSLMPLVNGTKKSIYDQQFYLYLNTMRGIRLGNWKLITYNVKNKRTTQLFNIKTDPLEIDNKVNNPEFASKLAELRALLKKAGPEFGDKETWYHQD